MRKGKWAFLLAIAVAVVLPLSFYIAAKLLKKDHLQLPGYFGIESVNGKDTIYRQVKDLVLTNQFGDTVSLNEDLKGCILVVDFFFTSCNTICPRLTTNMGLLQHAFRKHAKMAITSDTLVRFVSISVDPVADSPKALRRYGELHGVNGDRWWLLTGSKQTVFDYARNQLKVIASEDATDVDAFRHSDKFVVLDGERHIRGYYNGLDSVDLKRCADDLALLTMEKKKKENDK